MSTLLERLIATSRLSPIFARGAIERALRRAGASPHDLTPAAAKKALPELRRAIEPFLQRDTDAVMTAIEAAIDVYRP